MSRQAATFDQLIATVQECARCDMMVGCTRVLSWANGSPPSVIMFVGEAPGRLGADRTAVPFHGDVAGDNFEKLIALAGLSRRDIFVTNAVLCNPRDGAGNNAPPNKSVLRNCSTNLRQQIDVVQPRIVVTLGSAALESTRLIEHHDLSLSRSVRTANPWNGKLLVPLYHPGARALIHRNFSAQTADYYFVGELVRRLGRPKRQTSGIAKPSSKGWDIVRAVMTALRECSLFRLHKTMYLIDYEAKQSTGTTITNFVYIRQKDGPYCVELGSRWFKAFGSDLQVHNQQGTPVLRWTAGGLFENPTHLEAEHQKLIERVVADVADLTDSQLKSKSYLTAPMKLALRAERAGAPRLNRPLL